MKEQFIVYKPNAKSKLLLEHIEKIMQSYDEQGYTLTLRQLYYQLVSRDIIPNNIKSYNMVGNVVSQGRLGGMIDWSMIEDRVRTPSRNTHWENPQQILNSAARGFYTDHWIDQDTYIEVWCEKDAVSNIIEPVCRKYDVTFMANRGYSSQTAMYDAYRRLKYRIAQNKEVHIIYFGDHDPSGIDMTRDIKDRIGIFLREIFDSSVDRIALNMDQIEEYNPPENPAKHTDSRYEKYVEEFGNASWELDALEPSVLSKLVEEAIMKYINLDDFDSVERTDEQARIKILNLATQFDE